MSLVFDQPTVITEETKTKRRRRKNTGQTLKEPVTINVGKPVEEKKTEQKDRVYLKKAESLIEQVKRDLEAGIAVNAKPIIRKLGRVEGLLSVQGYEGGKTAVAQVVKQLKAMGGKQGIIEPNPVGVRILQSDINVIKKLEAGEEEAVKTSRSISEAYLEKAKAELPEEFKPLIEGSGRKISANVRKMLGRLPKRGKKSGSKKATEELKVTTMGGALNDKEVVNTLENALYDVANYREGIKLVASQPDVYGGRSLLLFIPAGKKVASRIESSAKNVEQYLSALFGVPVSFEVFKKPINYEGKTVNAKLYVPPFQ